MDTIIQIGGVMWKFCTSFHGDTPVLPIVSCGVLIKPNSESIGICYAIDSCSEIWLGLEKDVICLEYFDTNTAMDIVYNYNILAWIELFNEIPGKMLHQ